MIAFKTIFADVQEVTVTTKSHQVFAFLTLGATWTKWTTASGIDLVARYEDYREYRSPGMYLGTTVGPLSGRIRDGIIESFGEKIVVDCGHPHLLHSGKYGFSFINFTISKAKEEDDVTTITFETSYPHPFLKGQIDVCVSYVIKEEGLTIVYDAVSTEDTLLNLTNHAYFNLDGDYDRPMDSHLLQINGEEVVLVDDEVLGIDRMKVNGSVFDFRHKKPVMPSVLDPLLKHQGANGIDHYYVLNADREADVVLTSTLSKRTLTIHSSYPGITVYTTNYPSSNARIQTGRMLTQHASIAMEPHFQQLAIKDSYYPGYRLNHGEPYHHWIRYRLEESK